MFLDLLQLITCENDSPIIDRKSRKILISDLPSHSLRTQHGMNSETERKISFINLSLAELPTSYILEPDNIPKTCGERFISMTGGEQFNLFLLTIFMKFVALANNNELTFLKPDLTPNEAILIKTKIILSLEKTRLLNDLYGDHERIAVKYI